MGSYLPVQECYGAADIIIDQDIRTNGNFRMKQYVNETFCSPMPETHSVPAESQLGLWRTSGTALVGSSLSFV